MGDQHYALVRMRVGQVTPDEEADFRQALVNQFRHVRDLFDKGGMYLVYEKDFANCETEINMDDHVAVLSGILPVEAEIVWSWDHPQISRQQESTDRPRKRVWYIEPKEAS